MSERVMNQPGVKRGNNKLRNGAKEDLGVSLDQQEVAREILYCYGVPKVKQESIRSVLDHF